MDGYYDSSLPADALGSILAFYVIILLIGLASTIACLVITYKLAVKKGKSGGLWLVLALFIGWIATIIVACLDAEPTYNANYQNSPYNNYNSPYANTQYQPTANTWKCSTCGADNSANSKFCGSCGTEKFDGWRCGDCGTKNEQNSKFCSNCGNKKPE